MDNTVAMTLLTSEFDDVAPGTACQADRVIAQAEVNASYNKYNGIPPSLPQYMAMHHDIGNQHSDNPMWSGPDDFIFNVTACRLPKKQYQTSDEVYKYDKYMPAPDAPNCNEMVCIPGPCTLMEIDYQTYSPSKTGNQAEFSMFGIPACRAVFGRGISYQLSGNPATTDAPVHDSKYYKSKADMPPYAWAPIDGTDDPSLIEWRVIDSQLGSQCALPDGVTVNDLESIFTDDTGDAHEILATDPDAAREKCTPKGTVDDDYRFLTVWSNDKAYQGAAAQGARQLQHPQMLYIGDTNIIVNTTGYPQCLKPITDLETFKDMNSAAIKAKLLELLGSAIPMMNMSNDRNKNYGHLSTFVGGWYGQGGLDTDWETFWNDHFSHTERADLRKAVHYLYASCDDKLYQASTWYKWADTIVKNRATSIQAGISSQCSRFCDGMIATLESGPDMHPRGPVVQFAWVLRYVGQHTTQDNNNGGDVYNSVADNAAISGYGVWQAALDDDGNFKCADVGTLGLDTALGVDGVDIVKAIGREYITWDADYTSEYGESGDITKATGKIQGKINYLIAHGNVTQQKAAADMQYVLWKYLAIRYGLCTPTQQIPPYYYHQYHGKKHGKSWYGKTYWYESGPLWMPGTFPREGLSGCCDPISLLTRGVLNAPTSTQKTFAPNNAFDVLWGFDPGENRVVLDNEGAPPQPTPNSHQYKFICRLSTECNQITNEMHMIPLEYSPIVYRRDNAMTAAADRMKAGNLPIYPLGAAADLDPEIEKCGNYTIDTALYGRDEIQGEGNVEFNAVACSLWGYCSADAGEWTPWDVGPDSRFNDSAVVAAFSACCFCVRANYIAPTDDVNAMYASGNAYSMGNPNPVPVYDNSKVPLWGVQSNALLAPCSLPTVRASFCDGSGWGNGTDRTPIIAKTYDWSGCIMTAYELRTHGKTPCDAAVVDYPTTVDIDKDIVEQMFRVSKTNADAGIKPEFSFDYALRNGHDHGSMRMVGKNRMTRAIAMQFGADSLGTHRGRAVFVTDPDPDTKPELGTDFDDAVFWLLETPGGALPDPTDPCLQRAGPATVNFECDPKDAKRPNIDVCKLHINTAWDNVMPEPVGCHEVLYSAKHTSDEKLKQAFGEAKQPYDWDTCTVPVETMRGAGKGFKPQNPCRKKDEMDGSDAGNFDLLCHLRDGVFDWESAGDPLDPSPVCLLDQHCANPNCPTGKNWNNAKPWPCAPTSCGRVGYTQFHRGSGSCYAMFAGIERCAEYKGSATPKHDLTCEAWDPGDIFRWCTDDTRDRPPMTQYNFRKDGWHVPLYDFDSNNHTSDANGVIFARCCDTGFVVSPLVQDDQNTWPTGYTNIQSKGVGGSYTYPDNPNERSREHNVANNWLCVGHNSDGSATTGPDGGSPWADDFIRSEGSAIRYTTEVAGIGEIRYLDHTGINYEASGQSRIDYSGGVGACSSTPPVLRTLNDGLGSLYNEPHNWSAFLKPGGGTGQLQYVIKDVVWHSYESVRRKLTSPLVKGTIPPTFATGSETPDGFSKTNMPGVAPFVADATFKGAPAVPAAGPHSNETTFYSNTVGKDSSYSCDCGRASPVYACAKYNAKTIYDQGYFGTFQFTTNVASAVVDYMMCGWTWDQPPSALPFTVGLYIPSGPGASTMTTMERDPLGSISGKTRNKDLKRFFLDPGAPTVPNLHELIHNQSGHGNDFDIDAHSKDTVGGTNRVKVVRYPGSCIRWPYGRIHRSMLDPATRNTYFQYETQQHKGKYNGGLSYVGDEAIYAYCEKTGADNMFVFCNHDVMSLEDRAAWCDAHPDANSISVGAVMGSRDITDACNNSICVFVSGDPRWPTPTALWEEWNQPDTTVIVAPFSTAVAFGMQAGVITPSIVPTTQGQYKLPLAKQMGSHRFSDSVPSNSVPDTVLAVDMNDLLAVASLRALAAQPNVTISYQSVVDRLTRLRDRALAFNDYAIKQKTAMGATGCSSGWYTPILGEFLPGDNHWENYACGASSDFEPRMPPMQRVTLPGSTLASGAPGVPIIAETTATQCNAIRIFAPRFTAIDGINVTNAAACTITGLTAVPVLFGPGDNRNTTMAISVENPKTAAVAIIGYDQAVPKPTDAVANMSGSEFDITVIDPPSDYLGHIAAAIVHATGDIRVSCAEECTVVIQDVAANKRVAVTSNWAVHTLDVTDVTQVFGTAFEQAYFTQPPQHNTLLAVTAATLCLTTIGLLVAGAFARATPTVATTTAPQPNDGTNKASSARESTEKKATK